MSETARQTKVKLNGAGANNRKPAPRVEPVYDEENWPNADKRLTEAVKKHMEVLEQTNKHLATLAECASETISLVRKIFKVYVPWAVAGIAVAYPAVGKIISSLPPL